MPLQIRRGNTAEVNSITPLTGELIYNTQTGQVLVGDGATAGGIAIAGVSIAEAKDAAAASILAGTHKNISFSYDSTAKALSATVDILMHETIEADALVTGKIFNTASTLVLDVDSGTFNGNVSGNINGVVTGTAGSSLIGNVTGDVTGNTTGYHFGDVKGSVFADDSTLIIDGLNGEIHATKFYMGSAQITQAAGVINVPSNTTIGGQPFRIRIGTEDSTITTLNMNDLFKVVGDNGIETIIEDGNLKIRNNGVTPITPQAGEATLHYITFAEDYSGYHVVKADGNLRYTPSTEQLEVGKVVVTTQLNCPTILTTDISAGTVSSNGILNLYSNLSTGISQRQVIVGNDTVPGRFGVVSNSYFGANAFVSFAQHHSTVDVGNFQFLRTRGTNVAPTTVVSGDDIADITFSAHNGTTAFNAVNITAKTEGTIIAGGAGIGAVPGVIEMQTANSAGTLVTALTINSKQQSTFGGAITLATYADATARDAAIASPSAGMMVYITGTGKFQGYNGFTSTWDDLN